MKASFGRYIMQFGDCRHIMQDEDCRHIMQDKDSQIEGTLNHGIISVPSLMKAVTECN